MGYDPTGLVNWGGVALGIGLALLAVAAVAATVATAGAASPLAALAITAAGTAIGVAFAESAITTTIGAVEESPVVYDFTVTSGNHRSGFSLVYDYGTDISDAYLHDGKTSHGAYGVTYGTGLVKNYDKPGDFAGTFVDVSASAKFKNADVGVDIATDPANLYSSSGKWNKCYSVMMTSGLSTPAPLRYGYVACGMDYYWQVGNY